MKNTRKIIAILFAVVFILSLASCSLMKNDQMDELTSTMIHALIDKNMDQMKALSHPDYAGSLKSVEGSGTLDGELEKLTPTSREYAAYDSQYGGKTEYSEYDAVIGGREYAVKIRTLENSKGFGIIQFDINSGDDK